MQTRNTLRPFAFLIFALSASLLFSGCYTRLTTPKEAREFRATYPEVEEGIPIELNTEIGNMGNTFIMTAEYYLKTVRRFQVGASEGGFGTGVPFRFRPGSLIQIDLPYHDDSSIDDKILQVRTEGTIDVGPVQDFVVAGKTAKEVRNELQAILAQWFKDPLGSDKPRVTINIPSLTESTLNPSSNLGRVSILNTSVGNTNSSGDSGNSGNIDLKGNDTIFTVLSDRGIYSSNNDWNEIALYRKIRTERIDQETGLPFEYYLIILVNLQETLYENPNLNIDVQDGDFILLHQEKAPLIVEMLRVAQTIVNVHNDFTGVETVLEDIFKRNY